MDGFSFHYSVDETPNFSFTDAFEFFGDEYQNNVQPDRGYHSDGLFYGLPERTRSCFLQDGIQDLYPWQKEVLEDTRLLQGSNYLLCCSTNAGKTLPAEVLMLRTVWLRSKKVLMVLPCM